LVQVLHRVSDHEAMTHPDLIVGVGGSDDAGVYRLSESSALVQTVDFFTPIVDEADDWGRIAAANALSDVYAMGGTPLTALQLVGWPRDTLPFDLLGQVLEGAAEVMAGAGVTIVGGHSIDAPEPTFGFAITGLVDPSQMTTNQGAGPGDAIVLTKPIGTGVIATGIKRGVVERAVRDAAVASMVELNAGAAAAARAHGATAVTDVTGFGLLGHLAEMLGEVGAELVAGSVPILDGAAALAESGVVPGGTKRNRTDVMAHTDLDSVDATTGLLLCDAQTSGGLLVALPADAVAGYLADVPGAAEIGRFVDEHPGRIALR
jgi:selenide,water dikinase